MVAILREADRDGVLAVVGRHKVSAQAACSWKQRFVTCQLYDVRRLSQFEQENARLKKPETKRDFEIGLMKKVAAKKW
jgi:hypothetical protein